MKDHTTILNLFFDLPNTLIIGYAIFFISFVSRELMRRGDEARMIRAKKEDKGSTYLGILLLIFAFVTPLLFNAVHFGNATLSSLLTKTGIIIMIAGYLFLMWSMSTLGRFYSRTLTIQDQHRIVTTGPYRFIRHPGYFGIILVGLGLGLSSGSIFTLLTLVSIMVVFYSYRIHWEEHMMLATFGEKYKEYQIGTWRIIPFIY